MSEQHRFYHEVMSQLEQDPVLQAEYNAWLDSLERTALQLKEKENGVDGQE
jgi:hypothetical protein